MRPPPKAGVGAIAYVGQSAACARHPARLGKYQITRVIGEGAMGTVYEGLDPLLQRRVAVKAIRPQLLRGGTGELSALSLTERFRIEAQAAGRLTHPGIVAVYEYGEEGSEELGAEGNTAYIAMEYVKGRTLLHYLAGPAPLAEDDALSVAVQVLEALHHAHELGVWHRDIKPGNLIVTEDGCVKVADFGIARLEASRSASAGLSPERTLLLMGSPGYIAPERYTGLPPDRRVDIFSCGVLLYELLTGVPPFAGSASEVMYQVLHSDPLPPSRMVPARVPSVGNYDAVVAKALARRPDDRYATALQLRDALLSVARRPVSRRLRTGALQRAPAVSPRLGRPSPGLPSSNVFEMPTQRLGQAPPLQQTATEGQAEPSPWPQASLRAIEAALAEHLGPIATVLVRRAAVHCHDLPALLRHLVSQGLSLREQQAFVADVRQRMARIAGPTLDRAKTAPRPAQRGPSCRAAPPPVLEDAATAVVLRSQTVERAEALLLAHVGPIATVLVRRALAVSTERTGFFVALADEARACVDRRALLSALQRLA